LGTLFDVIIINPPKFAPTKAYAEKAQRAYKDSPLLAMKILNTGGRLIALSNSGGINSEQFKQVLSWVALDANKHLQIVEQINHPCKSPVRLSFPESEYLKGFICEVI
jgi:23S rRNA (cytosine1962-C5)-methyltransferase